MKSPGRMTELRSRYLLDLASEKEREAVEADFFADDESWERLQTAEDELFDAYAAGTMPSSDRKAFQDRYLASPEGRRRLAIVLALRQRAREAASGIEPGPRRLEWRSVAVWAALAASLAAVVSAAWMARQYQSLRNEVARLQAAPPRDTPPAPRLAPSPASPAPTGPRATQAVRLPARPPAAPIDVSVAPSTRWIRLEVALKEDDDSATFDAVVRRPDGEELWRQEGLAPARFGAPIVVMAPAQSLADGDYVLSVEGEPSREGPAQGPRLYRLRVGRSR